MGAVAVENVDQLRAVLSLLREQRVTFTFLQVGDIRVACPQAPAPDAQRPATGPVKAGEPNDMAAMRKRARAMFGKDLPDEELKQMAGAL